MTLKKHIFLLVIFLLLYGYAYSQLAVDAGEDKFICAGGSATLDGTVSGTNNGYCVFWKSTPNDPTMSCVDCLTPTVNPEENTTYTLIVTEEGFKDKKSDVVSVDLVNNVNIAAAAEKCCWNVGDDIILEQFHVVTTPLDFFDPNSININPSFAPDIGVFSESQELVNFSLVCGDSTFSFDALIGVVKPSTFSSTSAKFKFPNLISKISSSTPCPPLFQFSGEFSEKHFKQCCPDDGCVRNFKSQSGTGQLLGGLQNCDLIMYGVPGAYLSLVVDGNIAASITASDDIDSCQYKGSCFDGNVQLNVGVGLAATLVSKKVLRVQGTCGATYTIGSYKVCLPEFREEVGTLCSEINCKVQVTAFSFFKYEKKIPVRPKTCQ